MKLIITWVVSALAILLSAWLVPGANISGFGSALITALVLGAVNAIIRPIILIFTLPINILTLGLFTLIINASMVSLTAFILPGFSISNFWTALIFSLILSLANWVIEVLLKEEKIKK